jgi:hypothetical protein
MTDVGKLAAFTGYYAMNVAPGAFLSIDTPFKKPQSSP